MIWFTIWYRWGIPAVSIGHFCRMDLSRNRIPSGTIVGAPIEISDHDQALGLEFLKRPPDLVGCQIREEAVEALHAVVGPPPPCMEMLRVAGCFVLLDPEDDVLEDHGRIEADTFRDIWVERMRGHQEVLFIEVQSTGSP